MGLKQSPSPEFPTQDQVLLAIRKQFPLFPDVAEGEIECKLINGVLTLTKGSVDLLVAKYTALIEKNNETIRAQIEERKWEQETTKIELALIPTKDDKSRSRSTDALVPLRKRLNALQAEFNSNTPGRSKKLIQADLEACKNEIAPHQAKLDDLKQLSESRRKLTEEIEEIKKEILALEKQIKKPEEASPALTTALANLEIKAPVDESASAEREVSQQGKIPIPSARQVTFLAGAIATVVATVLVFQGHKGSEPKSIHLAEAWTKKKPDDKLQRSQEITIEVLWAQLNQKLVEYLKSRPLRGELSQPEVVAILREIQRNMQSMGWAIDTIDFLWTDIQFEDETFKFRISYALSLKNGWGGDDTHVEVFHEIDLAPRIPMPTSVLPGGLTAHPSWKQSFEEQFIERWGQEFPPGNPYGFDIISAELVSETITDSISTLVIKIEIQEDTPLGPQKREMRVTRQLPMQVLVPPAFAGNSE
jgi:hypothetical protein